MGYYINIEDSTFEIPADKLDDAYKAMCKLNESNEGKRGGSWPKPDPEPSGPHDGVWFAWMPWNYPEVCKDAQAIFEELGFYTHLDEEDGSLHIDGYDNKAGNEDLFLEAVSRFATGYITWRGEEGEQWMEEYGNESPTYKNGRVVYE